MTSFARNCATLALGAVFSISGFAADMTKLPPETGVYIQRIELPEAAMTRAVLAAIEESFRAPIEDSNGNARYIVDLTDEASAPYIGKAPPVDRLAGHTKAEMRNLARELSDRYGFEPWGVTSWVGNSIIAHLSVKQVKALQSDPRVTRITLDHRVRESALWSDSTGPQGQIFPWGTNAVGTQTAQVSSPTVFVLDSGVGFHQDLTNVMLRVAAVPGQYAVGCYSHATHVAGIIAGAGTLSGTTRGVLSGASIISVGVGTQKEDANQCSYDNSTGAYTMGLDYIKSRITWEGHVGIVNISSNGTTFTATSSIGQKILAVATPSGSYKGGLIVESAGNDGTSSCDRSYDSPQPADGILVVGAIDRFGQRVQPINQVYGFRNTIHEPGSNYGSCVELWAPGNWVKSAWGAPGSASQKGNITYNNYQYLSGTSMAAPHVSGLAAYVATGMVNPTSTQLETAVRSAVYAYSLGSLAGSDPIITVSSTGARPVAQPTVEFLINNVINGSVTFPSNQYFTLRYEGIGAEYCNLTAYMNGTLWYSNPNFLPAYDWYSTSLPVGTYTWNVDCVSPQGTHSTASATATITPPPPTPSVTWYVDNVPRNGQVLSIPPNTSFNLRYSSAATTSCDVSAFMGPNGTFLNLWYTANGLPTAYDWGSVQLTPNRYRWRVTCTGPYGSTNQTVEALIN